MIAAAAEVKPVSEIKAHSKPVTSLATVPSAPGQVVSASEDGLMRHWDVAGMKLIREFNHDGPILGIAVRPDGLRFASVGNQVVRLWEAATGTMLAERRGDARAQAKARLLEGEIVFARMDIDIRNVQRTQAEQQVDMLTKALEAATKAAEMAEKTLAEKREAAKQPVAEKLAAEQVAAAAVEALKQATAAEADGDAGVIVKAREAQKVGAGQSRPGQSGGRQGNDEQGPRPGERSRGESGDRSDRATPGNRDGAQTVAVAAFKPPRKSGRKTANLGQPERERKPSSAENALTEAETARETTMFTVNTSRKVLERDQIAGPPAPKGGDCGGGSRTRGAARGQEGGRRGRESHRSPLAARSRFRPTTPG